MIEVLILVVPAVSWKLWKDRNGTTHPNKDPLIVFMIMCYCVLISGFILINRLSVDELIFRFTSPYLLMAKLFSVSITGYALVFPYAFNWLWFKKVYYVRMPIRYRIHYMLNHLSSTAIPDKWFLKYNVHWAIRLLIYTVLFTLSITWFI